MRNTTGKMVSVQSCQHGTDKLQRPSTIGMAYGINAGPVNQPEDHNVVARLCQCFQLLGDGLVEESPVISVYWELGRAFMHGNCAILQRGGGQ